MITIDVCRSCHILWFDDKEYSDLPKAQQGKMLGKPMSAEAERALAALKSDLARDRSFLFKLMDDTVPEELELEKLLSDLFKK